MISSHSVLFLLLLLCPTLIWQTDSFEIRFFSSDFVPSSQYFTLKKKKITEIEASQMCVHVVGKIRQSVQLNQKKQQTSDLSIASLRKSMENHWQRIANGALQFRGFHLSFVCQPYWMDSDRLKRCNELMRKKQTIVNLVNKGKDAAAICDDLLKHSENMQKQQKPDDAGLLSHKMIPGHDISAKEAANALAAGDVASLKKKEPESPKSSETCDACRFTVRYINQCLHMTNINPGVISAGVKVACSTLMGKSISHQCDHLVKNIDNIILWIKEGKKPTEICQKLSLCQKLPALPKDLSKYVAVLNYKKENKRNGLSKKEIIINKNNGSKKKDDPTCELCTQITAVVETAVKKHDATIEEIEAIMQVVCEYIPEKDQCSSILAHVEEIVDWINKGLDAHAICQKLGFCKKKNIRQNKILLHRSSRIIKDFNECTFCTEATHMVESALLQKDNATLTLVEEALNLICQHLPTSTKCRGVVDKFDDIVAWVRKGLDPHTICVEIGFCSPLAKAILPTSKSTSEEGDTQICELCAETTSMVTRAVLNKQSNESLELIHDTIQIMCQHLPSSTKCGKILDNFDNVVKLIRNGENNPRLICSKLKFCPDSKKLKKKKDLLDIFRDFSNAKLNGFVDGFLLARQNKVSNTKSNLSCKFCNYAGQAIQVAIQYDDAALPMVKQDLQQICVLVPPLLKCDLLTMKFDDMVKLIKAGKSVPEACDSIGMCKDTVGVSAPSSAQILASKKMIKKSVQDEAGKKDHAIQVSNELAAFQ